MTTLYRLLGEPPEHAVNASSAKLYGTPRKGGLVFSNPRPGSTLKRLLCANPGGWGVSFEMPDDQLEAYRFDDVRAKDFPELLLYYLNGNAVLPNFEQVPVERGLDAIACGGGLQVQDGVKNVLLPGSERTTWAR